MGFPKLTTRRWMVVIALAGLLLSVHVRLTIGRVEWHRRQSELWWQRYHWLGALPSDRRMAEFDAAHSEALEGGAFHMWMAEACENAYRNPLGVFTIWAAPARIREGFGIDHDRPLVITQDQCEGGTSPISAVVRLNSPEPK